MSKKQIKNTVPERADKMVKPSQSVRRFNFPNHNITLEAQSHKDALEKLEEHLKSKQKNDG